MLTPRETERRRSFGSAAHASTFHAGITASGRRRSPEFVLDLRVVVIEHLQQQEPVVLVGDGFCELVAADPQRIREHDLAPDARTVEQLESCGGVERRGVVLVDAPRAVRTRRPTSSSGRPCRSRSRPAPC
jgi:hypothetical protein